MNILHLSDLHFGSSADAANWYSQLAFDLKYELKCSKLDFLVYSGDIANKSVPNEYNAAEEFTKLICSGFDLSPDRIVIVPGNHDVSWVLSKKSYKVRRSEEYKRLLNENDKLDSSWIINKGEFVEIQDPKAYKQRFKYFATFY